MLSFIKHNFDSIDGIGIYPMIAILIFFPIFIFAVAYVFVLKKKYFNENANLPFEDDEMSQINSKLEP
jgi:cytochrome c oxidase cbb3-type subunit IV